MRKLSKLFLVIALLSFATRSSANYPVCALIDDTECDDGRVVCQDGEDTGACTCVGGYWGCLYSGGDGWW